MRVNDAKDATMKRWLRCCRKKGRSSKSQAFIDLAESSCGAPDPFPFCIRRWDDYAKVDIRRGVLETAIIKYPQSEVDKSPGNFTSCMTMRPRTPQHLDLHNLLDDLASVLRPLVFGILYWICARKEAAHIYGHSRWITFRPEGALSCQSNSYIDYRIIHGHLVLKLALFNFFGSIIPLGSSPASLALTFRSHLAIWDMERACAICPSEISVPESSNSNELKTLATEQTENNRFGWSFQELPS